MAQSDAYHFYPKVVHVNQRAPALISSLTTPIEPSSTPSVGDAIAKPKVMRRPAQFSKPTTRSQPTFIADTRIDDPTATAYPSAPQAPTLRPWQDDARFAFALLTIVIVINLALSVWLAPKTTTPPTATATPPSLAAPAEPAKETTSSAPESLIYHLNEAGASVSEQ